MLASLVRSVSLGLTAITAGINVRDVISYPGIKRLDGPHYARYHQEIDREFARAMPVVGQASLVASVATVAVSQEPRRRALAALALACNAAAVAVTVTREVPLNKQVQSWSAEAPPDEWRAMRERWFMGHRARTALSVVGLGCLIAATVR